MSASSRRIWILGSGNLAPMDGGGAGGTQNVPKYEGSNPTSTVHPPPPPKKKKKKRISDRPKNILNFNTPKNIPILFLELKKRPENT